MLILPVHLSDFLSEYLAATHSFFFESCIISLSFSQVSHQLTSQDTALAPDNPLLLGCVLTWLADTVVQGTSFCKFLSEKDRHIKE